MPTSQRRTGVAPPSGGNEQRVGKAAPAADASAPKVQERKSFDATLLKPILKAAKSRGQTGCLAVEALPEAWPQWYRELVRKVPLGGLCVYVNLEGETCSLEVEFFTPEGYNDFMEEEQDYWAEQFEDMGLVPIARASDGGAWLIDKDSVGDSPVDYYDHSAAMIRQAFPSFRDFVAALTMEYSTEG